MKPQQDGYKGMKALEDLFRVYGYRVKRGGYYAPFDLLLDDSLKVEIKTCLGIVSKHVPVQWQFNIHRHGKNNEANVDIYVLRFENIPGFKKAAHALVRAPIGKRTLAASLRSLIIEPFWGESFRAFEAFLHAKQPKPRKSYRRVHTQRSEPHQAATAVSTN